MRPGRTLRAAGHFSLALALLASALALGLQASDAPAATTTPQDTLQAARFDWDALDRMDAVDLEGTPHEPGLPHLAFRVDAAVGALEAVYAIARGEADLEPVFQIAYLPLLVRFDPPLPVGSGLSTIEPLRLQWESPQLYGGTAVGDDDRNVSVLGVEVHAAVPLPANGTSPPEDPATATGDSGIRLHWRTHLVESALPSLLVGGAQSPAMAATSWSVRLGDGTWGAHNVTWNILLDSRTQNHGTLHPADDDDPFLGVYLAREEHRAAYRFLPRTAVPTTGPWVTPGDERSWQVLDLTRGPIPESESLLLPMRLMATTTAPLDVRDDAAGDGVILELGFQRLSAPTEPPGAPNGPDGAAKYPTAPAWWVVAGVLLAAALVLAPRGRRGRATNA